ncbi:MAG: VIT1/CCC1 transporter family protein [Persicimonas sp.]
MSSSHKKLHSQHQPDAIRERLEEERRHSYLGDGILGAIDGGVTTFAVVSGVAGGGLSSVVVLILGFANLLADGFSMAVSNFQATKSTREQTEKTRERERRHIEAVPEGEREEIRQIYAQKGFEGEALDHAVELITSDEELWIDTMIQEEYGLPLESPNPLRAGAVTFVAFLLAGLVPLIPFVFDPDAPIETTFPFSILFTGLTFLGIGMMKGKVLDRSIVRGGLETLFIGGAAAAIAYGVGKLLRGIVGV